MQQKMKRISLEKHESEQFYIMPKWLFQEPYLNLSNDARVAYCLLKDRFSLSIKNNWVDENNDIFLVYSRKELASILGVGLNKVTSLFKALVAHELINDVQQGLNKSNRIYILEPVVNPVKKRTLENQVSKNLENKRQETYESSTNNTYFNQTDKEEEEEKGIFKNSDEALIFAKGFLKAKIKHDANYEKVCNYIEVFIDDMKSLRETSIKSYCLKILEQHDKEPVVEQEQPKAPKQPKQKRTYPAKNTRTEIMPAWDNEPINLSKEEEEAQLAQIKELMGVLK